MRKKSADERYQWCLGHPREAPGFCGQAGLGDRALSPQHAFATQTKPCCWHKTIHRLRIVCKAFRKISRLGNERETLIKENLLIFSSPGCSFSVALSWPNYWLLRKRMGNKVWIFSSSFALALELVLRTQSTIWRFTQGTDSTANYVLLLFSKSYPVPFRLDQFLSWDAAWAQPKHLTTTLRLKGAWNHTWGRPWLHLDTENSHGPGQLSSLYSNSLWFWASPSHHFFINISILLKSLRLLSQQ